MELGTRLGELLMPNYDNHDGEEDCNSDDDHENDAVDESGNNADDGPAQATRWGEPLMPNYDQQYDYHIMTIIITVIMTTMRMVMTIKTIMLMRLVQVAAALLHN